MFDKTKIITGLYGLVGLRQPTSTAYAKLDAANYGSRSGYYSTDNPFCKVEFIIDGIDDISASDAQINTYIKQMQESAITEVCNKIFDEPDYIDRNMLFKNAINLKDTAALPVGFVGYEIKPSSKKNIAFEIPRIILNFKGTGTVKLLLFCNEVSAPLFTKSVSITSSHQSVDLGWVMDNSGNTYKGSYYIGYIGVIGGLLPYKRNYKESTVKSIISELTIESVYVPNVITETIWDMELNQYGVENDYGLNPDITVFYDYTDLILRNEKLFSKAIDLAYQIKIINSYLTSTRSNKNERLSAELAEKAVLELNGVIESNSVLNKIGLIPTLRNEIAGIKTQIQKLKDGYFGKKQAINLVTLS